MKAIYLAPIHILRGPDSQTRGRFFEALTFPEGKGFRVFFDATEGKIVKALGLHCSPDVGEQLRTDDSYDLDEGVHKQESGG